MKKEAVLIKYLFITVYAKTDIFILFIQSILLILAILMIPIIIYIICIFIIDRISRKRLQNNIKIYEESTAKSPIEGRK